jgi:hypothetical protein
MVEEVKSQVSRIKSQIAYLYLTVAGYPLGGFAV